MGIKDLLGMKRHHVKYSAKKPPIFAACQKHFGVSWESGVIITYGDTAHSIRRLTEDVEVHEAVHVKQQQKMGKDVWWARFFEDPNFRLLQEAPAYKAQWLWVKANWNRAEQRRIKKLLIDHMTRGYGGMCDKRMAERLVFET